MEVTVRLLASYRQYLPEGADARAGYRLEVPEGTTVVRALGRLLVPRDEICTYFVNGRHAERDQVLQDGDILSVFPAVGGGQ
jgi:molybdopterin converting factor small subunit